MKVAGLENLIRRLTFPPNLLIEGIQTEGRSQNQCFADGFLVKLTE